MQFGSEVNQPLRNNGVSTVFGTKTNPFDYPMPNRADCMSLSTINTRKDQMKTTTFKFMTNRAQSNNMSTNDIFGKLYF